MRPLIKKINEKRQFDKMELMATRANNEETINVTGSSVAGTAGTEDDYVRPKKKRKGEEDEACDGKNKDEATGDKAAYQAFFNKTLKKYGVDEPDKLSASDKKKFFDEIDAGWKGDDEVKESFLDEATLTQKGIDGLIEYMNASFKKMSDVEKKVFMKRIKQADGQGLNVKSLSKQWNSIKESLDEAPKPNKDIKAKKRAKVKGRKKCAAGMTVSMNGLRATCTKKDKAKGRKMKKRLKMVKNTTAFRKAHKKAVATKKWRAN